MHGCLTLEAHHPHKIGFYLFDLLKMIYDICNNNLIYCKVKIRQKRLCYRWIWKSDHRGPLRRWADCIILSKTLELPDPWLHAA